MDNIKFRTRRGAHRLDFESEMESGEETLPQTDNPAGDGKITCNMDPKEDSTQPDVNKTAFHSPQRSGSSPPVVSAPSRAMELEDSEQVDATANMNIVKNHMNAPTRMGQSRSEERMPRVERRPSDGKLRHPQLDRAPSLPSQPLSASGQRNMVGRPTIGLMREPPVRRWPAPMENNPRYQGEASHLEGPNGRIPPQLPYDNQGNSRGRAVHMNERIYNGDFTAAANAQHEYEDYGNNNHQWNYNQTRASRPPRPARRLSYNRSSSDDEDIRDRERHGRAKLPPFTGKEKWEVWYNRFQDVAIRRGWSTGRKLDEVIQLIQGAAGDFVYGQLSEATRRNYDLLIQELACRYKTVEQRRTMAVKFSHREQRSNENVQDYAADLKLLYDRAHPDRDRQTRKEDLLRRFLDGLSDEEASFHVEYVKEPADIDEAVNHVINFRETRRRPEGQSRKQKKVLRAVHDDSDDEDRIARLPNRPQRNNKNSNNNSNRDSTSPADKPSTSTNTSNVKENVEKLQSDMEHLRRRVDALERQRRPRAPLATIPPREQQPTGNQQPGCYRCGQPGHYARGCTQQYNTSHHGPQNESAFNSSTSTPSFAPRNQEN